jgi:hypothetical protein
MQRGRGYGFRRGRGGYRGGGYDNSYRDGYGRNTPAPRKQRKTPAMIGSNNLKPEELPIYRERQKILTTILAWKVVVI